MGRWLFRTAAVVFAVAIAGGALAAYYFLAVAGEPEEEPSVLSLAVAPPLPAAVALGPGVDPALVAPVVAEVAAQLGGPIPQVLPEAEATQGALLTLRRANSPGAEPLVVSYWVPVVNFFHDAEDIPSQVLRRLLNGEAVPWSEVGSAQGGPIRLLVAAEEAPSLAAALGVDQLGAGATLLSADQVRERLSQGKGAMGLVPLAAVDHRLRSLAVDGVHLVLGGEERQRYPITERLWLSLTPLTGTEDPSLVKLQEALAEALRARYPAEPPETVRLLSTGDIIFGRCTYTQTVNAGTTNAPFLTLGDFLRAADIAVGNMDNPVTDRVTPLGCGTGTLQFTAPVNFLDGVAWAGFDVITQGSNHLRDYGDGAVLDTLVGLDARGIGHVGGGADEEEARRPLILEVKGVRFAFLAGVNIDVGDNTGYWATENRPGSAPLSVERIREDVADVRDQVDFVILSPQWGPEYIPVPSESQREMAEAALDAGVSLILGNHPHIVQGAYWDERGFVAYSHGNFVYDQSWCFYTERGTMTEVIFGNGRILSVRYIPVFVADLHRPEIAQGEDRQGILEIIEKATLGQVGFERIC